jgi:hypothetical protein
VQLGGHCFYCHLPCSRRVGSEWDVGKCSDFGGHLSGNLSYGIYPKVPEKCIHGIAYFIVVVHGAITSAFFVDPALGLVNILWYFLLAMLTLFTMGRRSALLVSIVSIGPFVYYAHYLMFDNFHNEKLYETASLVMMWFACSVGLYLVYYISNQFIKSKEVAEAG